MAIRVEDPSDPRLDDYRLLKDPARRSLESDRKIFVVEGRHAVDALLGSRYEIVSLLLAERQAVAAGSLVAGVEATGAPVHLARREVLASTVGFDLHRGVVAIARRPEPIDPQDLVASTLTAAAASGARAVFAVLEALNDHENLGALFRNAAAFGVSCVLLDARCADPLYRRAVRVSLGHVLAIPFARVTSWPADLSRLLTRSGVVLAALAPEASGPQAGIEPARDTEALPAWAMRRATAPAVALLLGAEGPGLSRSALELADDVVAIPMTRGVDSINVATAAAIAFYELRTRWPWPDRGS